MKPTPAPSYVLIRADRSGVHFGEFVSRTGREVTLHNARRVWSWEGRFTLSAIANHGLASGSYISEPVAHIEILDAIEVIPLSHNIAQQMYAFPSHEIAPA